MHMLLTSSIPGWMFRQVDIDAPFYSHLMPYVCGMQKPQVAQANCFFCVIDGMVGNFSPTLPAPGIGGASLEELYKNGGVEPIFNGVS